MSASPTRPPRRKPRCNPVPRPTPTRTKRRVSVGFSTRNSGRKPGARRMRTTSAGKRSRPLSMSLRPPKLMGSRRFSGELAGRRIVNARATWMRRSVRMASEWKGYAPLFAADLCSRLRALSMTEKVASEQGLYGDRVGGLLGSARLSCGGVLGDLLAVRYASGVTLVCGFVSHLWSLI